MCVKKHLFNVHVFRAFEIACIALVAGNKLLRFFRKRDTFACMQDQCLQIIRQIETATGPKTVFDWPSIIAAPAPSMDVANLEPGQVPRA